MASAHLEEVDFVQCYLPLRGATYRQAPEVDAAKRYPESYNAIPFYGLAAEPNPSLFGAKMDARNPDVESDWWEPVIKTEEDYDRLEMPDLKAALLPRALERHKQILGRLERRGAAKQDYIPTASILGPVDLASQMRGYDRLLADFLRCPGKVHRLFDLLTRMNVEWIELSQEVVGELKLLTLADHGLSFLSRKLYPIFGLPYWRRELSAAPKEAVKWYHNEGHVTNVLEAVPEMGADVFHFGWVDIAEAKRRIGDRVCLCGNLNSTSLLLEGSKAQVAEAAKKAIDVAAPGSGFILSSSGGMAPKTPIENVDAMYEVACTYGKYPLQRRAGRRG